MIEALMGMLGLAFLTTFWGFAFLIAMSIAVIVSIEFESNIGAVVALVVGTVIYSAFMGVGVPTVSGALNWLDVNWLRIIAFLVIYVLGGAGWSIVKYIFWVHDERDDFKNDEKKLRSEWASSYDSFGGQAKYPLFPDYHRARWNALVAWSNNKSRIVTWMAWWPWSAFWTLLRDPLKRAWQFFYEVLSSMMKSFSDWIYNKNFSDIK